MTRTFVVSFHLSGCHTHMTCINSISCCGHTSQVCGGWVGCPLILRVIAFCFSRPPIPYLADLDAKGVANQCDFSCMCVSHQQSMCGCNLAPRMFSTPVCNDQKKTCAFEVHVVMFACRVLMCRFVLMFRECIP